MGAKLLANDTDTIILQSGGFGQWRRVKEVAWTFREVLKLTVDIFAVFDRDYRPKEEIERFLANMQKQGIRCVVLQRKEIENYVLLRANLIDLIKKRQEMRLPEENWYSDRQISRLIEIVSNEFRHDTFGQLVGHRIKHFHEFRSRIDPATISMETTRELESVWKDIDRRLAIIPGKDFIARLSSVLQEKKSLSITINMLIDNLDKDLVPPDLIDLIAQLELFVKGEVRA